MTPQQLVPLVLQASLMMIVFSIGLKATLGDAVWLFRRPQLLFKSVLAMNGVMLVVAAGAALIFKLPQAIEVGLVTLALSPCPPIIPNKQMKAGGSESYTIGLFMASAALAMVLIPVVLHLLGMVFHRDWGVPIAKIASVMGVSVILPTLAGMLVRRFWPTIADKVAGLFLKVGWGLLALVLVIILAVAWRKFADVIGNGALVALAAFSIIGCVVGHLLGGPDPDDRTVLALATSTRHPSVAAMIAAINMPSVEGMMPVVFWHLILAALVTIPYVKWVTKRHAARKASLP